MTKQLRLWLVASVFLVCACGGDDDDSIAVAGTWRSNFDSVEVIDDERWGFASIVEYDNAARTAITQNPADDMYNPSKFNKYVWTPIGIDGSFYYCTVDYGLLTADAARTTVKTADANDLNGKGCQGFPWTKLTRATTADAGAGDAATSALVQQ